MNDGAILKSVSRWIFSYSCLAVLETKNAEKYF